MPATAGRVRMPANNRVHSSAALQTHGIWQSAIGYDPYAPTNKDDSNKKSVKTLAAAEPEGENAYASFQGLLQLAKITNSNSDEARGACKKCGRVGHLTFQCRNFLSVRDDVKKEGKDDDLIREVVLEKLKGEKVKLNGNIKDKVEGGGESSEEEEEESEISDSDYDSEIERIIAKKYGKKGNCKRKLSSGRKDHEGDDDDEEEEEEDEEDEDGKKRKKRGRSKKRSSRKMESSESEDADEGGRGRRRKKRKEKRCIRDDDSSSSDDGEGRRRKRKTRQEKRRRRSHRHSSEDSSEESPERGHTHKRRSRRVSSPSDSDVSVSDDSRVGRYKKRDDKTSKKRHREREN